LFLNIPDDIAANLIAAENYVIGRTPDTIFRTDWIDFPAGPTAVDLDTNFATIGDFFNDYISEVSSPGVLAEPFGNFLVRFSGFLRVEPKHDSVDQAGVPIWVDFGAVGYDGYRLLIGETIYRFWLLTPPDPADPFFFFFRENPIVEMPGLYRIEFTYINRYDPTGELGSPWAGMELHSWHGGGLPWPMGERMIHPLFGPGTIVPPRVIYQQEDVQPVQPGDFTADTFVDFRDLQFFQSCFTGPGDDIFIILNAGCHNFDFDDDIDVDLNDWEVMQGLLQDGSP